MGRRKKQDGNGVTAADSEQGATRLSNVQARRDVIAESFERLYALDTEIDALTKEHLDELRTEKSEIKKRLREDFQMPAPLVQCRYQSYKFERKAEESGDDKTMDAIREMYEIMPVGGQADFLGALEREGHAGGNGAARMAEPVPLEPDNDANDHDRAHDEGRQANRAGHGLDTCPYKLPRQTKLKATWETGWQEAQEEGPLTEDATDLAEEPHAGTA